MNLTNKM